MNYPNGIKRLNNKNICYGNRGMILESDLNESNNFYLINNVAIIHKKPTSITIKKVEYPSKCEAIIKEGYFKTPSTTDYNGIYKGKYIDFEAKETKNKSFFPLNNIHNHQIKHLRLIIEHGGIGFIIVRFSVLDETYYLGGNDLLDFLKNEDRKSIPISYFKSNGFLIKTKFNPRVDYLEIVNNIYFGGDHNEKHN